MGAVEEAGQMGYSGDVQSGHGFDCKQALLGFWGGRSIDTVCVCLWKEPPFQWFPLVYIAQWRKKRRIMAC